jgi:putative ubiquitin-RnfH superfamily antitoxin RatB of RatAB toxin-antitoxin module
MAEGRLHVTVMFSPGPREVREWVLELVPGSTVADAIAASGMTTAFPAAHAGPAGVWGRSVEPAHLLRDGDRVEVYRPLRVDPKVARRERFSKQGKRAAGLFARKR